MADKIYKCKKCQKEFTDLSEYKTHCLHCKGVPEEETVDNSTEPVDNSTNEEISEDETLKNDENLTVEPENKDETLKNEEKLKVVEEAQKKNTCRGLYEGNIDGICKNYVKCSDCWNDFKG